MTGALLSLRDVKHRFIRSTESGPGISLQIGPGEIVGIIGASGSGKTTILRLALGLLSSHGAVEIGRTANGAKAPIGVVFQGATFLPWKTIEANVQAPLAFTTRTPADKRVAAHKALRAAALAPEKVAALYPDQLSGGMRARVALARALVNEPALLMLDEPFASLDEYLVQELHAQLTKLADRGIGAAIVTHDIANMLMIANRLLIVGAVESNRNPTLDLDAMLGARGVRRRGSDEFESAHNGIRAFLKAPQDAEFAA